MLKKIFKNKEKQKGFTLIEVVIVLAILALIARLIIPEITEYIDKSKIQKANENIRVVGDAMTRYYIDTGHLPSATSMSELNSILTNKENVDGVNRGPWVKKTNQMDKDPWGREFEIILGTNGSFDLISKGPDETIDSDDIYYSGVKEIN